MQIEMRTKAIPKRVTFVSFVCVAGSPNRFRTGVSAVRVYRHTFPDESKDRLRRTLPEFAKFSRGPFGDLFHE
jgi:hypothetical protein